MRSCVTAICLATLGWLTTGCQLSKAYPAKRFYQLTVAQPDIESGPGGVLRVQTLEVAPAFSGKGLVSQISDVEFESDYYGEFFTSPNEMLTELVATWLRSSGGFDAVVGGGSSLSADYVVEGLVDGLYLDQRNRDQALAVVSLQLRFIDDRGGKPDLIATKRYRRSEPVASATSEASVGGWNRALRSILIEVSKDLNQAISAVSNPSL